MRKTKSFFLLPFLLFGMSVLHAQTGTYDVRFNIPDTSIVTFCNAQQLYIDIEVKANTSDTEFSLGEQNYRFSFNKDALANPVLIEELDLQSGTALPSPAGVSFYSAHNLNGTLDSVVSYNIEHLFGDGVFVSADEWLSIGRVGFDVLDPFACYELTWHDSATFPSTFISELNDNGTSRDDAAEGNFTDSGLCYNTLCLMPIELLDFRGEASACRVRLHWATATEENSSHFIIERSYDGISFEDIGRMEAAGYSQDLQNYEFNTDQLQAYAYYRLKQVDFDGQYAYTDVIRIHSTCFEPGGVIEVYPNPVYTGENVNIKLQSATTESAQIVVTDINGRVVSDIPTQLNEGPNMLQFSISDLPNGSYFVQMKGTTWNSTAKKILKIND